MSDPATSASLGDILIACLIEPGAESPRPHPASLIAGCDLTWLPHAARYHGVAGYVYQRLKDLADIDAQVLSALATLWRLGIGEHLRALGDLNHLQTVLDGTTVPWLVADGPVLAETGYSGPGLRAYGGMELIVSQDALPAALSALGDAGCQIHRQGRDVRSGGVDLTLRYGTPATLRAPVADGAAAAPGSPAPGPDILDRARRVRLESTVVATLDPVDALVYLAARAAEHSGYLGRLKDLERLSVATTVSWDEVVVRARAWGMAALVGGALRRAREMLLAPVPADVIRALATAGRRPAHAREAPVHADGQPTDPSASVLFHLIHVRPEAQPDTRRVDWDRVVTLAVRERLAPLAFVGLDRIRVPDHVAPALGRTYREAVSAAADAYWQAVEVLRALRSHGVTPILLKGAAMAQFVYQDVGVRPFVDHDFLVQVEQIEAVHRALLSAGYAMVGERPTDADLVWRHGRAYFDPSGHRISVDVHWRYLGYPSLMPIDYAGIFARATEVFLGEEPVLLAAPCDMVVATSAYFLRELWYGKPKLRYLRDLAELSVRTVVDWDRVVDVAAATPHLRSPLYLTLSAAAELLGAVVPEDALVRLRPRRQWVTGRLAAAVSRNVLRSESAVQAVGQVAAMRWVDEPSAGALLRWLLALLFVPRPLVSSRWRWLRRIWRG